MEKDETTFENGSLILPQKRARNSEAGNQIISQSHLIFHGPNPGSVHIAPAGR